MVQRVLSKSKLEPLDISFSNLGDLSKANLVTYCDASVGKLNGTDTVVGTLSFVKGENGYLNVLEWQSQKLQIPSTSPLAGECQAAMIAYGKIKSQRELMSHVLHRDDIGAKIITDSQSLKNALGTTNSVQDSRTAIGIKALRAIPEVENIDVVWARGENQLADPLTKEGASATKLTTDFI